jgi:hypothetical protein
MLGSFLTALVAQNDCSGKADILESRSIAGTISGEQADRPHLEAFACRRIFRLAWISKGSVGRPEWPAVFDTLAIEGPEQHHFIDRHLWKRIPPVLLISGWRNRERFELGSQTTVLGNVNRLELFPGYGTTVTEAHRVVDIGFSDVAP